MKSEYNSIVLITPGGKGQSLVERLYKEGIQMVDCYHARGSLPGGPTKKDGSPIEAEQDLVTCVVESARADEIFGLLYEEAQIATTPGSFLYARQLNSTTRMTLPSEKALEKPA